MPEITIQNVNVFLDEHSVTFLQEDTPDVSVALPISAIGELVDFLNTLNPDSKERRRAFRVAVPPSVDLRVRFALRGKTWSAIPADLSLTGILIEFPRPEVLDLPLDTTLKHRTSVKRYDRDAHGSCPPEKR